MSDEYKQMKAERDAAFNEALKMLRTARNPYRYCARCESDMNRGGSFPIDACSWEPSGRAVCFACVRKDLEQERLTADARIEEAVARTTAQAVWWRRPIMWLAWKALKPAAWLMSRVG